MKCSYKYVFLFSYIQILFFFFNFCISLSSSSTPASTPKSSIVFATLGRSSYNFDIYTLPIQSSSSISNDHNHDHHELKLTDGISVNFNGHFPIINSTSFSTLFSQLYSLPSSPNIINLIYVSERNGTSNIYLDSSVSDLLHFPGRPGSRSSLEIPGPGRVQIPLLRVDPEDGKRVSMKDRPSLVGEHLIYVSNHENSGVARTSWAAVYSTHIPTGSTRRLTPYGVADFSPAVSPSGIFTAVASYGEKNWEGDLQELRTNIYVFLTRDGSGRVKVVEHGGWPCWVDDRTIYFHRRDDADRWWSIYKVTLPRGGLVTTESMVVERVTPLGLHVFTPTTSPGNDGFIVVATRRPGSNYRHIELFDLKNKEFKELTRPISPNSHHFNPFISPDGTRVGYHKCRGRDSENGNILLENLEVSEPEISLFRIDGTFPSFSPKGDRIAYVGDPDNYLYVVDSDGMNKKLVYEGLTFTSAWDPIRKGVVYTSVGPNFASVTTKVDIISINIDDGEFTYKKLTHRGENNAFPSPSPDGKRIVFRSSRSGYKNLYIMDAEEGEIGYIHRLTEGPWTDTMCNWSPDGEWIAFASNREMGNGLNDLHLGSFEVFMIHPNGTGLHKVIQSGSGGLVNHPWFSPDGKSIVFTSDYAGVSAEPISYPNQFQPYGEIFIANIDGSNIRRLTHNSYEDGTPTWGPIYLSPSNVVEPAKGPKCVFEDCYWLNIRKSLGIEFTCDASVIEAQC